MLRTSGGNGRCPLAVRCVAPAVMSWAMLSFVVPLPSNVFGNVSLEISGSGVTDPRSAKLTGDDGYKIQT